MAENFVTKTNSHKSDGWLISTENIELFVTEEGGQIAPVTFTVGGKAIMPYHLTPWQDEDKTGLSGALKNLRGEIFCMPFGGNAELVNGEKHPAHGEVSGEKWSCFPHRSPAMSLRLHSAFPSRSGRRMLSKP